MPTYSHIADRDVSSDGPMLANQPFSQGAVRSADRRVVLQPTCCTPITLQRAAYRPKRLEGRGLQSFIAVTT